MLRYAIIKNHFEKNPKLRHEMVYGSYKTAAEVMDDMESLFDRLPKTVPDANDDEFTVNACENEYGQLILIEVIPKSDAMYSSDYYHEDCFRSDQVVFVCKIDSIVPTSKID